MRGIDVSRERSGGEDPDAEEASGVCVGGACRSETFRQKDRETYHILNLVLYGSFIRAKDRKGRIEHTGA